MLKSFKHPYCIKPFSVSSDLPTKDRIVYVKAQQAFVSERNRAYLLQHHVFERTSSKICWPSFCCWMRCSIRSSTSTKPVYSSSFSPRWCGKVLIRMRVIFSRYFLPPGKRKNFSTRLVSPLEMVRIISLKCSFMPANVGVGSGREMLVFVASLASWLPFKSKL